MKSAAVKILALLLFVAAVATTAADQTTTTTTNNNNTSTNSTVNDELERFHQILLIDQNESSPSVIEIVNDMFARLTESDIPYHLRRQYGMLPSRNRMMPAINGAHKGPQSLSILMNFGHDGTTSVHLADYHQIYWSDSGYCQHGQMFDPLIGVCRDLFCTEGHILLAQGCAPDPNYDSTQTQPGGMKLAQEMSVELNMDNKICELFSNYNISSEHMCDMNRQLFERPGLCVELSKLVAALLAVNASRVDNLKVYSSKLVTKQVDPSETQQIIELNTDNHYVIDIDRYKREKRSRGVEVEARESTHITEEQKDTMFQKIERIRVGFTIKPKTNETSDSEPETVSLFFKLVAYAFYKPQITLWDQAISFSDVIEIRNSTTAGWCSSEGEEKSFLIDGFRILASYTRGDGVKNRQYFIYVIDSKRVYGTGYFYLGIWYDDNQDESFSANRQEFHENIERKFFDMSNAGNSSINMSVDENTFNITYDNEQLLLSDVTDLILGKNSTKIKVTMVNLVICDRPRIRTPCYNHTTIRLRKCELDFIRSNKTYCWPAVNKCFSLDEYEIDSEEPFSYIRICQFVRQADNSMQSIISHLPQEQKKESESFTVPGWVSFISIIISLTCMVASLVTYFLFSELRNIPGWNIINLTLALFLAQSSFMIGSLVNSIPTFCFVAAIMTHYGFLAAFFWMNVIAFDLYRNFRAKSSHVLLKTVTTRDRLLKYALFAWLSPLVFVAVPLIIDLAVKASPKAVPIRPCYAGYLQGCSEQGFMSIKDSRTIIEHRATILIPKNQEFEARSSSSFLNGTFSDDATCMQRPLGFMTYYLSKSCWIQSGRATLVFFGIPVGIIIVINAIYYFISIYNIRKKKNKQKKNDLRRYSRAKLPGDEDVKFYMQMAVIMGFTWVTGFFMSSLSDDEHQVLNYILIYTFILSNASTGVFILVAFIICKPKVKLLYQRFYYKHIHDVLLKVLRIKQDGDAGEKPPTLPSGAMGRRNGIIRFSAVSESSTASLDNLSPPPAYRSTSSMISLPTSSDGGGGGLLCMPSYSNAIRKHFIRILPSVSMMTDESSSVPRLQSVTPTQSPLPLLAPESPFAGYQSSRQALHARADADFRCSTSSTSSSFNDEVFLRPASFTLSVPATVNHRAPAESAPDPNITEI